MNDDTLPSGAIEEPTDLDHPDVTQITAEPPPPPGGASWMGRRPPALRRIDLLVLLLILLATGASRFVRLGEPGEVLPSTASDCKYKPLSSTCYSLIPLDEVHYVPDARDVVRFGTESDTRVSEPDGPYVVHPPVAKWYIALGIRFFGDRPLGWRFFGAVFGTFGVLILYLLALRLWRSPWWAAAAAVLLAADGLWFVQSRVAMLDIYAGFFILAAVWLIVMDRDETPPDRPGVRWWLIAAGVMLGLALATKWETAPFVVVAIATAVAWDMAKARRAARKRIVLRLTEAVGVLTLLPAMVYVATFTPWFADSHRYNPPLCTSHKGVISQWWCYQGEVLHFHEHLSKYEKVAADPNKPSAGKIVQPAHPYFGQGWSWPWVGRPVAHYYKATGQGAAEKDSEILGLPNPFIWWPAFAIGFLALAWWTLRLDSTATLLFSFFVAGFVPYLAADAVRRPVFLFYATPLIPFVVLTVVHVLFRMVDRWPRTNIIAITYIAGCAAAFGYFYPILAAVPIPRNGLFGWAAHVWFKADCLSQHRIKLFCWI